MDSQANGGGEGWRSAKMWSVALFVTVQDEIVTGADNQPDFLAVPTGHHDVDIPGVKEPADRGGGVHRRV